MSMFNDTFGRRLSVKDVSALTGSSLGAIYRHYQLYGGIKVGRKLLFFEGKLVKALEALYASQAEIGREDNLARPDSSSVREAEGKDVSDEKGGGRVGGGDKKKTVIYLESRHGLW